MWIPRSANFGTIIGNQLSFFSVEDIVNFGTIGSENNIILSASNLDNYGLFKNLGDAKIDLNNFCCFFTADK